MIDDDAPIPDTDVRATSVAELIRRRLDSNDPWRLALVTVFQFLENLSDRQAADAVRTRGVPRPPPLLRYHSRASP